jgi:AcrR family transcriptional regulator
MNEKKTDRRTIKTRKAICEAFAELLTEKQFHKITVQEIADKADVNRVTFYKHYPDVYDLYNKIEEEVLVDLGLLILQLNEIRSDEFFSCLVGYIKENKSIFKMMFSPNGTNSLREKFGKMMEGLFRKLTSEKKDIDFSDERVEYLSCYRTQGCIAIVGKWVLNDFSKSEKFIIKTLSELNTVTENMIFNN